MTPQFTTPCYVCIKDADKRKEVCEELIRLGYYVGQAYIDALDEVIVTYPKSSTFCTGSKGQFDKIDLNGCLNCRINTELFLAFAGMRSDTDKGQWFIRIDTKELYLCKIDNFDHINNLNGFYRRVTAQEIINHF